MAPGNAEIKKERDALDKLVKKLAFEHAMAYDEPKTLLDTISYEDMRNKFLRLAFNHADSPKWLAPTTRDRG